MPASQITSLGQMPLDKEIVGRALHYNCLIAELAIYLPFQDFQARQLFPRLLLFSSASFKLWKSLVSFSLNSSLIPLTSFQAKIVAAFYHHAGVCQDNSQSQRKNVRICNII
jgi:hypothetical protein